VQYAMVVLVADGDRPAPSPVRHQLLLISRSPARSGALRRPRGSAASGGYIAALVVGLFIIEFVPWLSIGLL
jgi:hypothetical protein